MAIVVLLMQDFTQKLCNLEHMDFFASPLRQRIRDMDPGDGTVREPLPRRTTEKPMGRIDLDFRGAGVVQLFGGAHDGSPARDHVVHDHDPFVLDIPVTQCNLHIVAAETLLGEGNEQAAIPLAHVLREGDGSLIWSHDHINIFKEALQEGNRNPVLIGQILAKARAVPVDRQHPVDRKTRDAFTNH